MICLARLYPFQFGANVFGERLYPILNEIIHGHVQLAETGARCPSRLTTLFNLPFHIEGAFDALDGIS
jgi:hypothetical protein